MNENFFGDPNYKMPVTSNYMKFKDGENTFRVLSSAITGYVYFNTENKPIRSQHDFDVTPGKKEDGEVKHFWAFAVWNYADERVQILELTQKGVMGFIQSLVSNKRWGNPTGYDITVNKSGAGLKTDYEVMANPHSPLEQKIAEAWSKCRVDLRELYTNGDPFKPTQKQPVTLDEMPTVDVDYGTGEVDNTDEIPL